MVRRLACLALLAACAAPEPPPGEVELALTAGCSLQEVGAPCDPGDGADECDGICWVSNSGTAVCRRLFALGLSSNYLDGRLCGSAASTDCGDGGRICVSGACQDTNGGGEPVFSGRSCRPTLSENRCAGACDGTGACRPVFDPCSYGRGLVGDGNCLFDTCGGFANDCVTEVLSGQTCDDDDPCTSGDTCTSGRCTAVTLGCSIDGSCYPLGTVNPNNPCEECDATWDPFGWTPSDFGTLCAVNGDGRQCIRGTCDGFGTCHSTNEPAPDGTPCSDGDGCTGPDMCTGGACGGEAVSCADSDPCTIDRCDPATGCLHDPDPACGDAGTRPDGGSGGDGGPTADAGLELTGSGCTCRIGAAPASGPAEGAGAPALLALALVALARSRRRRARAAVLAALFVVVAPSRGRAQGFDTEILQPPVSATSYFSQEEASVLDRLHIAAGLVLHYGQGILVVRDGGTGEVVGDGIVAERLGAHLAASVGLGHGLEVGAALPVVLTQDGDPTPVRMEALPSTAMGDLRVGAKMLLHDSSDWNLAASLTAGFGLGGAAGFAGDGTFSLLPRVVVGWREGRVRGTVSLGYRLRDESPTLAGLQADDEVTAGAAAMFAILPERLSALAEAYAYIGVAGEGADTPAECLAGLHYQAPHGVAVKAGLGRGLGEGYGTPSIRALLALEYTPSGPPATRAVAGAPPGPEETPPPVAPPPPAAPPPAPAPAPAAPAAEKDQDGDKIADRIDRCPAEPEDEDGFADGDGCPDLDDDEDGFPDVVDKCPREAETFNAVDDQDGCADKGTLVLFLGRDRIELKAPVAFDRGGRPTKAAQKVLGTVATVLLLHPEIKKVRIKGAQAEAVRRQLVNVNGIEAGRLEAVVERGGAGLELLIVDRE